MISKKSQKYVAQIVINISISHSKKNIKINNNTYIRQIWS